MLLWKIFLGVGLCLVLMLLSAAIPLDVKYLGPAWSRSLSQLTLRGAAASALLAVHRDVVDNLGAGRSGADADVFSFRLYRSGGNYLVRVYLTPTEYLTYIVDETGSTIIESPNQSSGSVP